MQPASLRAVAMLFVLMSCVVVARPAAASFGDCNDEGYLKQFDHRLGGEPGFLCVESERIPVQSDAGTTHVRIIEHLLADWAARPGAMAAIKEGVAASVREMGSLGSFRISDVTILLVDGYSPTGGSERFGDIGAHTGMRPGDECRITMWLLGAGSTVANGGPVVAHELFHCVQRSSLTQPQIQSSSSSAAAGGGTWWTEGSATWFSTVAVSKPSFLSGWVSDFDASSSRTPLNLMRYEAYVFFAWLGGARGRDSVMPFLHAMAPSAGESAQRRAMVAALPADQWLRFAEDYRDQRIRDGQGADIGSTPQPGDPYTWDATRTQRIELPAFVLTRADITVRCGRWRFEPTPARFHAARPADGTTWGPLPTSLDAMDGTPREFRFVGMAASTSDVSLQIVGTREAACNECAATREIDQCLIGTWELTSHGAEQWMREHGNPVQLTSVARANNTMTLLDDGTFSTGAARVAAELQSEHIQGRGRMVGQASGRWSAAGGRFNVCPDARTLEGTVTVTVHGRPITVPAQSGPSHDSSQPYVCSGTSLRVSMSMGSAGTVDNIYTKVSGPR